jgi:hypothetical protein
VLIQDVATGERQRVAADFAIRTRRRCRTRDECLQASRLKILGPRVWLLRPAEPPPTTTAAYMSFRLAREPDDQNMPLTRGHVEWAIQVSNL